MIGFCHIPDLRRLTREALIEISNPDFVNGFALLDYHQYVKNERIHGIIRV